MDTYPKHEISLVLHLPKAIIEQHADEPCSEEQLAEFLGVKYTAALQVQISSAIKYSLLKRPDQPNPDLKGRKRIVETTPIARRIHGPTCADDETMGLREAVTSAPQIGAVYNHYQNRLLPEQRFFRNALVQTFQIPEIKAEEFETIFLADLAAARLIENDGDKRRVVASTAPTNGAATAGGPLVPYGQGEICFVIMPFAAPIGGYYEKLYRPAIEEALLVPVRADASIFGAGKIMNQIWSGIDRARVCLADLTGKNPNVFYELGIAHSLNKPVVLITADIDDVPSDLRHLRVVVYDKTNPFWGDEVRQQVAQHLRLAITTPEFIFDHERLAKTETEKV